MGAQGLIAAAWAVLSLGALAVAVDELATRIRYRRVAEECRRRALRWRLYWRGRD